MLTEMRDTVGVVAASMGTDPEKASVDEFMAAIDKVREASQSGQIRTFTGNEYIKDIPKGDSWVILGWSGDAVQLKADNPNIEFVIPESAATSGPTTCRSRWARRRRSRLRSSSTSCTAGGPGAHRGVHQLHHPGAGRQGGPRQGRSEAGENQLFPDEAFLENTFIFRGLDPEEEANSMTRSSR